MIWSERQCCVQCDDCMENEICGTKNMAEFKKWLRERGWSIGRYDVYCPKCRMERKNEAK